FATGKVVLTLPGHWNEIGNVAFSPDGKRFGWASDGLWGGEDRNLFLWETGTWKPVPFAVPRQRFHGLAFSPDGKHLATASAFAEALIWPLTQTPAPAPPGRK